MGTMAVTLCTTSTDAEQGIHLQKDRFIRFCGALPASPGQNSFLILHDSYICSMLLFSGNSFVPHAQQLWGLMQGKPLPCVCCEGEIYSSPAAAGAKSPQKKACLQSRVRLFLCSKFTHP
jgi:hypothetical protein